MRLGFAGALPLVLLLIAAGVLAVRKFPPAPGQSIVDASSGRQSLSITGFQPQPVPVGVSAPYRAMAVLQGRVLFQDLTLDIAPVKITSPSSTGARVYLNHLFNTLDPAQSLWAPVPGSYNLTVVCSECAATTILSSLYAHLSGQRREWATVTITPVSP